MDYRDILKIQIEKKGKSRGYKSKLAKVAGCQLSYFIQVLKKEARLSPEQAMELCEFWEFDEVKTDYFILLVYRERAVSIRLQLYLDRKMESYGMNSDFAYSLIKDLSGGFEE